MSSQIAYEVPEAAPGIGKIFYNYANQLSDCLNGGELPWAATQDNKFYLTLQREKLLRLGITVKDRLEDAGLVTTVRDTVKVDAKYINHNAFRGYKKTTEYYLGGSRKHRYSGRILFYQSILDIKAGSIDPGEPLSCPHCGAPSTIGQLQNGCQYCGTKFMMTDLYPRTSTHYFLPDFTMSKGEGYDHIWKFAAAGTVLYPLFKAFASGETDTAKLLENIVMGCMLGIGAVSFWVIFKFFYRVITGIPMTARTEGRLTMTAFMQQYDPGFSFDYFTHKALALLRMMLYSDNISDLAIYAGNAPVPQSDVIDAFFRGGISVNDLNVTPDGFCCVTADLYMRNICCSGGRIFPRNDVFRMTLVKSIRQPDKPGFSYKAVKCPVCGQSFDVTRINHCPACSNDYRLENDDWVVTYLQRL